MAERERSQSARGRLAKLAFGVMALLSLLAGAVIFYFADQLGFDEQTARIVALTFLIAGFADYLILHFWDKLIKPHL